MNDSNPRLRKRSPSRPEAVRARTLCQIIYDYGGTVETPGDELNFVLNADRAADPAWATETIQRLRQRIGQLRAAGEPGLAKRVRHILAAKRAVRTLSDLVG